MPEKLKCIHQDCHRPVIMRCAECGAPVCEFHSTGGRFCSEDCHKYGKRKLERKKEVRERRKRQRKARELATKVAVIVIVFFAVYMLGLDVFFSVPGSVDTLIEEWVEVDAEQAAEITSAMDSATIYPCGDDGAGLTVLTPGSVTFMPLGSSLVLVVGIPPYNMELFQKDDMCVRVDSPDLGGNYSSVVLRGNFSKITNPQVLLSLTDALQKETRLTEDELSFVVKASKYSHSGLYMFNPFNATARTNKAIIVQGEEISSGT